jgi:hypothetical protein
MADAHVVVHLDDVTATDPDAGKRLQEFNVRVLPTAY